MDTIQPEHLGFSAQRLQRIDPVMQRYIDEGKLAGIVTLLSRRGQVVHQGCYGFADVEAQHPMQPDTLFRIWSMTKWVTAVAAMIAFEEGRFTLNQPIADFLPEFKETMVFAGQVDDRIGATERKGEITIRQLLTHTSGLGVDLYTDHPINARLNQKMLDHLKNNDSLSDVVRSLAEVPLIYQPGTKWYYSLSLEVVARLVEVVSGQPYHEFLKARILEPLGMHDTVYKVTDAQIDRFSALYGLVDDKPGMTLLEAPRSSPDYTFKANWTPGSFGLVSSAPDYWRFAQMLLQGGEFNGERILNPRTVALLASNHLPPPLMPYHFEGASPFYGYGHGLGVHVLMDRGLAGTLCANGEYWKDGGAGTLCWIDPQEELVGVVMYQHTPHWIYPVFGQFKTLAYQAMC